MRDLPFVDRPFDAIDLNNLVNHAGQIRRLYDWPGIPYHDANEPEAARFNRWCYYQPPVFVAAHRRRDFVAHASKVFGVQVVPSYVFVSLYGPDGVCPPHTDRPQCRYTIDLCLDQDGTWPIYVEDKPYVLDRGDALYYSGSTMLHYRHPMADEPKETRPTFCNLAFFHFVPAGFMGPLG